MTKPFETMLSRFGTQFVCNLQPNRDRVRISPVGPCYWNEYRLGLNVQVDGESCGFPFGDTSKYENLSQSITPTSLELRARQAGFPIRAKARFFAPFVPRDAELSGTPAIYLDVELQAEEDAAGHLHAGVATEIEQELRGQGYLGYLWQGQFSLEEGRAPREDDCYKERLAFVYLGDQTDPVRLDRGLTIPFSIRAGQTVKFRFLLACCVCQPLLEIGGQQARLDYASRLSNLHEVIAAAIEQRDRLEEISAKFDQTLLHSELSVSARNLASYAFQSYVASTIWARKSDGGNWYAVVEGGCGYLSTIDEQYNEGVFYLWYWPELLKMQLQEWPVFKQADGYMEHDIGAWHRANGMRYGHQMQVEENCNYLLLLFAYWRWTGDFEIVEEQWTLVRELLEFIEQGDTTGNGWPDKGTVNTLDSGGYAVECASEQTYQAIRILSVLEGAAMAAERMGQADYAEACRSRQMLIRQTLQTTAWVGNHYAVCLDKRIRGHNTYGMMATNGLVFPLLTGSWIPAMDWSRMRQDIGSATQQTRREFGCAMTAVDNTGWISQNIFRDIAASYLGLDLEYLCDDYWAFEVWANQEASNCFKDGWPTDICGINYYPRGIAAFGLLPAKRQFSFDRVSGVMQLDLTRPGYLSLPWAANWSDLKIPEITIQPDGSYTGRHLELLGEINIEPRRPLPKKAADRQHGNRFDFFWGRGLLTGRHGLWGKDEASGLQAFEVVSRWQAAEGLVPDSGEFSLEVPEGWTYLALDSPVFYRNARRPQKTFSCRWAVRVSKDFDWPDTSVLRSRVQLADGTAHQAELMVRPDPRRELTAQRITDLEQGLGLAEIKPDQT